MLGAINEDLAKKFKVNVATIKRWMVKYPDFCTAIKKGRETADEDVAISLYKRSVGYNHPETKAQWVESDIFIDGEFRRVGRWEYADLIKHYPPDTAACFIWLKNRKPKEWKDKKELGLDEETINIIRLPAKKEVGDPVSYDVAYGNKGTGQPVDTTPRATD